MARTPDISTRIRHEAQCRDIPYLLHFTQAQNLCSIVDHGLLSRSALESQNEFSAHASARVRLDEHNNAVSISVAAINARMFNAKTRDVGTPYWVVLMLEPSILWTHRCRFLRRSGASNLMKEHRGRLDGFWGFTQLFSDPAGERPQTFSGTDYRAETHIPSFLPTYPDAEIQVLQPIAPNLICGAWVGRPGIAQAVQDELDRLPGTKRPTCVQPFSTISNDHDRHGWVMLLPD